MDSAVVPLLACVRCGGLPFAEAAALRAHWRASHAPAVGSGGGGGDDDGASGDDDADSAASDGGSASGGSISGQINPI